MSAKPSSESAAAFVDDIVGLCEKRGAARYGAEAVTQLEHALQCAALAQAGGAGDELVAAAFLHDIGHLLHEPQETAAGQGANDRHEFRALHKLRRHFGDGVLGPIRLHVVAKRYLCMARPEYRDALSTASRLSLELQGGPLTAEQARAFLRQPYARDAVRLRLWDDQAKVPGRSTPRIGYFSRVLLRCAS